MNKLTELTNCSNDKWKIMGSFDQPTPILKKSVQSEIVIIGGEMADLVNKAK